MRNLIPRWIYRLFGLQKITPLTANDQQRLAHYGWSRQRPEPPTERLPAVPSQPSAVSHARQLLSDHVTQEEHWQAFHQQYPPPRTLPNELPAVTPDQIRKFQTRALNTLPANAFRSEVMARVTSGEFRTVEEAARHVGRELASEQQRLRLPDQRARTRTSRPLFRSPEHDTGRPLPETEPIVRTPASASASASASHLPHAPLPVVQDGQYRGDGPDTLRMTAVQQDTSWKPPGSLPSERTR